MTNPYREAAAAPVADRLGAAVRAFWLLALPLPVILSAVVGASGVIRDGSGLVPSHAVGALLGVFMYAMVGVLPVIGMMCMQFDKNLTRLTFVTMWLYWPISFVATMAPLVVRGARSLWLWIKYGDRT